MTDETAAGATDDNDLSIEMRFMTLEASNRMLSADVKALTTTLRVVNQLQQEQRNMIRRNEETERKVQQVETLATHRATRARNAGRQAMAAVVILLPLASFLVYWVLFQQMHVLLNQSRTERLRACQMRNEGTLSIQKREAALAAAETNAQLAKLHADSANQLAKAIINCQQLYGTAE